MRAGTCRLYAVVVVLAVWGIMKFGVGAQLWQLDAVFLLATAAAVAANISESARRYWRRPPAVVRQHHRSHGHRARHS